MAGFYKNLNQLREFAAEAARQAGLDDEGIYAIKLAVDEACANIIEHAYDGEGQGDIECTCETSTQGITVTLRDWGKSFDPDTITDPDLSLPLEELTPRGAGLFLIRNLMDEVNFDFSPRQGNRLRLIKRK